MRSRDACIVTLLVAACGGVPATPVTEPPAPAEPEAPPAVAEESPSCDVELTLDPDEVVAELEKTYATIDRMTAKFRHDTVNTAARSRHTFDGKVWLAKQGQMRWDYYKKQKTDTGTHPVVFRSIISNGTYLYSVDHDAGQVVELVLGDDVWSNAVTFFADDSTWSTGFDVATDTNNTYGSGNDYVLALTPKPGTIPFETVHLVVDACDFHVKESVLVDASGTVDRFRFYEPDPDRAVQDKWFRFSATSVPDYQVIPL